MNAAGDVVAALGGKGGMAPCVAHDDTHASLSLSDGAKGLVYFCHAGCTQEAVGRALRERGFLNGHERSAHHITGLGEPSKVWTYRSASGAELLRIARYETAAGKEIRPWIPDGATWISKGLPPPRPLYGLDLLATRPDAPVLIVEGEKACDAARALIGNTHVCITWPGGAKAVAKANFEPLRARTVIVWPDADAPGNDAAQAIVARLRGIAASVNVIDAGERAKGWDAADALAEGFTEADVLALLSTRPAAPANRFRSVTMIDLVEAKLPEREPLLYPWLCVQGLAQTHAWRGVGKTHFSLGVAYAVATSGTFLRWTAPKAQPTLFLDGEMPAVALQERLKAKLAADDRNIELDGGMLRFITPDLLDGAPPDLADAQDQGELQRVIDDFDPKLIVVDNISTLVRSGGAENDAEAWIPVQEWALRMRREGRSVLFVHHSGKGGKQRGTSKREDVLDVVIALNRSEPYDPADGARFVVEFEKARYLRGDDTRSFEAQLGTDPHGRQVWTMRDLEDSTLDRAVALYRDGITTVRGIADELGVNPSTVSRALRKAKAQGLITDREAA